MSSAFNFPYFYLKIQIFFNIWQSREENAKWEKDQFISLLAKNEKVFVLLI